MDDQEWFTNAEVANRYRTTVGTVRHWRLVGYGPKGVRVGTRVLYHRDEIRRFDEQMAEQAKAGA